MEAEATRRGYDAVALDYAERIADELDGKPLDRALLAAFAELVGGIGGGTVADVGCGPGHVAADLATRGLNMIGLDLSPAMAALAARRTALPYCAADMTALPIASNALAGIVCFYAVLHLDDAARRQAYQEFSRTLRPGGRALVAFHTSAPDAEPGDAAVLTEWWGHQVDLTFRYLDPEAEIDAMRQAGLSLEARMDREPHPGTEHPSRRTYLLMRRNSLDSTPPSEELH